MKLIKELTQLLTEKEHPQTDSKLSPAARGRAAAGEGMGGKSMDYNKKTGEYNPYPSGSGRARDYDKAYQEEMEALKQRYPHS